MTVHTREEALKAPHFCQRGWDTHDEFMAVAADDFEFVGATLTDDGGWRFQYRNKRAPEWS